ncbi:hypothetical protein RYX36_000693, partial [Vicia faba]
MLAAQNIIPGTCHTIQVIFNAIQLHLGVQPLLVCFNRYYLAEVHICFDVTATNHRSCPIPSSQTCASS